MGDACLVCDASPRDKAFNDEHIIPPTGPQTVWFVRQEMTLPTGEFIQPEIL